jgi:hypothetical protein
MIIEELLRRAQYYAESGAKRKAKNTLAEVLELVTSPNINLPNDKAKGYFARVEAVYARMDDHGFVVRFEDYTEVTASEPGPRTSAEWFWSEEQYHEYMAENSHLVPVKRSEYQHKGWREVLLETYG